MCDFFNLGRSVNTQKNLPDVGRKNEGQFINTTIWPTKSKKST